MNAVQVVEHFLVEGSQFIVQPNDSVKSAFVTFRSMWAAAAILVHRELHVFFHSMLLAVQSIFQINMGHHFIESIYRIIYFNNSFHIHL